MADKEKPPFAGAALDNTKQNNSALTVTNNQPNDAYLPDLAPKHWPTVKCRRSALETTPPTWKILNEIGIYPDCEPDAEGYWHMACSQHKDTAPVKSLHINAGCKFHCDACKRKGNSPVSLIRLFKNVTVNEAVQLLLRLGGKRRPTKDELRKQRPCQKGNAS